MTRPRLRIEGETRVEMNRRLGTYEKYRADFETWILEERRSLSWIAVKVGKSYGWVSQVMTTLEIYTRRPPSGAAALQAKIPHVPIPLEERTLEKWEPPHNRESWRKYEHAFQRVRLAYCSAWDRGW